MFNNKIDNIETIYYNIKNGISNLIRWFPVVWKDRDWDHTYIYDVLHFKLKNTEHCIRNGSHVKSDKDADRIKICVNLLGRLIKDDYYDNVYKHFDKKWGELSFGSEKDEEREGYCKLIFKRSNDPNNEREEERDKEYKKLMNKEGYLIHQDLDLLFDIMKKNIQKWWD